MACQGTWLARLVNELIGKSLEIVKIFVDNKSAIALSKNPLLHSRSKHIDTQYHFIMMCVEEKKIELEYIQSIDQLAHILTKVLVDSSSLELHQKLGVCSIDSEHQA